MLSSLAVFKKAPDGGLLRYAAAGWPKGTAWHIFAGDPLVQSFAGRRASEPLTKEEYGSSSLSRPNRPVRQSECRSHRKPPPKV